ncbi:hypothetical protein PBRA_008383 [Plasmodiophora brassicae]|nr:hypothetical protein PBRA_008383 [Plasmodiophora brassicae]
MMRIHERKQREATFRKRNLGLIKKAKELAVLCDVDVALVVMHKSKAKCAQFSSADDIEHLWQSYVAFEGEVEVVDQPGRSSRLYKGTNQVITTTRHQLTQPLVAQVVQPPPQLCGQAPMPGANPFPPLGYHYDVDAAHQQQQEAAAAMPTSPSMHIASNLVAAEILQAAHHHNRTQQQQQQQQQQWAPPPDTELFGDVIIGAGSPWEGWPMPPPPPSQGGITDRVRQQQQQQQYPLPL